MAVANGSALRTCNDCKQSKPLSDYGRNAGKSDGIATYCRLCLAVRARQYRENNYDRWLAAQRERQRIAKESGAAKRQAERNTPEALAAREARLEATKQRARDRARLKYAADLDSSRERMRSKRAKNPRAHRDSKARYRAKAKLDPAYVVNNRMSARMNHALKHNKEGRAWRSAVDYTLDDLMRHLERQFTKGMGWHNMGEWHIDHIVPVSAFDIPTFDAPDFSRAWALANLRPLWAHDNIVKRANRVSLL